MQLDSLIHTLPHYPTETMIAEDPIKLELESDEDIPSLRRFCGGRAPLVRIHGLKDDSFTFTVCNMAPNLLSLVFMVAR